MAIQNRSISSVISVNEPGSLVPVEHAIPSPFKKKKNLRDRGGGGGGG
jgi:hypothetical protein